MSAERQAAPLRVWGRRSAFNVQKVLWALGELGIQHEIVATGGDAGGKDDPVFRRLSPAGRVPAMQDGDVSLWESHAILRYLAERHGSDRFWPRDPVRRAPLEAWIEWSQTELQPAFMGVFWNYWRTPAERRHWPTIWRMHARCIEAMSLLDTLLAERPFIGGDAFSLADIPAGCVLYRYHMMDLERPRLHHVEALYARLSDRAAYRSHVMVPFADLAGRMEP